VQTSIRGRADGPALPILASGKFGQRSRPGAEVVGIDAGPGAAAFDITQNLRREQVTHAAGDGEHVFGPGLREEGRECRKDLAAADVAKVEHALDAEHKIAGELIVAADLGAADYAGAFARAEVCRRRHRNATENDTGPGLVDPGPTTANISADVACGTSFWVAHPSPNIGEQL
jgi:hypothetical protein